MELLEKMLELLPKVYSLMMDLCSIENCSNDQDSMFDFVHDYERILSHAMDRHLKFDRSMRRRTQISFLFIY